MTGLWIVLTALSVGALASQSQSLQYRDSACGSPDQVLTQSRTGYHCCPGTVISSPGKQLCCVGGKCAPHTICTEQPEDCKWLFNVDDLDYEEQVKDKAGITLNEPDSSDSGSDSGSTSSSSSIVSSISPASASQSSDIGADSFTSSSTSTSSAPGCYNTAPAGSVLALMGAMAAMAPM